MRCKYYKTSILAYLYTILTVKSMLTDC